MIFHSLRAKADTFVILIRMLRRVEHCFIFIDESANEKKGCING